jgi:hypothetical protein
MATPTPPASVARPSRSPGCSNPSLRRQGNLPPVLIPEVIMHHDVRDLIGWGVFDASGKLISVHKSKLDARIAAFRYDHIIRRQPPGTPDAFPF